MHQKGIVSTLSRQEELCAYLLRQECSHLIIVIKGWENLYSLDC